MSADVDAARPLSPQEAGFHIGWHHCSADDAIGLFLECLDRGLSEPDARVAALAEFDEGMSAHAACGLCGQPPDDSDHGYGGTHNWRPEAAIHAEAGTLDVERLEQAVENVYPVPEGIFDAVMAEYARLAKDAER